MANKKQKGKRSNSGGGTNGGSSPENNDDNNGREERNRGNQNKGKVPQEFAECRICNGRFHWESDCRKNPAGIGKRSNDSPNCRECNGTHWEDQCRAWKSKNGAGDGNDKKNKKKKDNDDDDDNNNNKNKNKNNNNNNNNKDDNDENDGEKIPTPGQYLAPTGEDITKYFPKGKFPSRPCRKCKKLGHWNDACEKEGFDPVTNPNPVAKKNDNSKAGVDSLDDKTSGKPNPDTDQPKNSSQPAPERNPSKQPSPQTSPAPLPLPPKQPRPHPYPNDQTNTDTDTPDYLYPLGVPPYALAPGTGGLNPGHPSHPDSAHYQALHRSHNCSTCGELGHDDGDCQTYLWLLPRTHSSWRPHPDLHHASNALYPRPDGYWRGDPRFVPSRTTYIWPHPQNRAQGLVWSEDDAEEGVGNGGRDVWVGQDDGEGGDGRRLRWGLPPGGYGGEEHGGMCQFDAEGDVVMVDVLDLEWRRWVRKEKRRVKEEEAKPWWMKAV